MVYSEKTHVEYIYPLLSQLEGILEEKGFKPKRLGDEIRNSEDYLETLESMVEDCSLALIVLDGFRPNVLFEFGYLKGKKKPIIVLQSRDAQINIKTLYRDTDDSGLTSTQFHRRLSNPKLDVSFHLSDFAGKHVTKIDWRLKETDPLYTPPECCQQRYGKKGKK
jgi:nucleoside 2-deoxyribosyltransferase